MSTYRIKGRSKSGRYWHYIAKANSKEEAEAAAALAHPKAQFVRAMLIDRHTLRYENCMAEMYQNAGGRWKPVVGRLRNVWRCYQCLERITTEITWKFCPTCPNCKCAFDHVGYQVAPEKKKKR
jgi:rubrerythrin